MSSNCLGARGFSCTSREKLSVLTTPLVAGCKGGLATATAAVLVGTAAAFSTGLEKMGTLPEGAA